MSAQSAFDGRLVVFDFSEEAISSIRNRVEDIRRNATRFDPTIDSIYLTTFLSGIENDIKLLAYQLSKDHGANMVCKQDAINAMKRLIIALFREQKILSLHHRQFLNIMNSLTERIRSTANPNILDVGCGWGKASKTLAKHITKSAEIVGVDINILPLQYGKSLSPDTSFLRSHMKYLPFRDQVFEVVLSSNALHEIENKEDKRGVLMEFGRVLKQGGAIHVFDPFSRSFAAKLIQRFLRTVFSRIECYHQMEEFEESLNETGFKMVAKNCLVWPVISLRIFCSYIAVKA